MSNQYPFSLADIVAYFDSIQGSYPAGLPTEFLSAAALSQESEAFGFGSGESGLCFLGDLRSEEENWKLLQAAIEKGLKLSPETVYFVELASLRGDLENFAGELQEIGIKHVVALGELAEQALNCAHAPGVIQSWRGFSLLSTLALSQVLGQSSNKKIFWQHLQTLMQELLA